MFFVFWEHQYAIIHKHNKRWYINDSKVCLTDPIHSHDIYFFQQYTLLHSRVHARLYLWCQYNLHTLLHTDLFIVTETVRSFLFHLIFNKPTFLFPCVYVHVNTGHIHYWNNQSIPLKIETLPTYTTPPTTMNNRILEYDMNGVLQYDTPLTLHKPYTRDIRRVNWCLVRTLHVRFGVRNDDSTIIWEPHVEHRMIRIDSRSITIPCHDRFGTISFYEWHKGIYFSNSITCQIIQVDNIPISFPMKITAKQIADTASQHMSSSNPTWTWNQFFNNTSIKQCPVKKCHHVVLPPNAKCIIHKNTISPEPTTSTPPRLHQCQYIIKIGKKKGEQCTRMTPCEVQYCKMHQAQHNKNKSKFKIHLIRKKHEDGTVYWIIKETNLVTFQKKGKLVSGYIDDQGKLVRYITNNVRSQCTSLGIPVSKN